jgi:acyl-CoA hydrolase
MEGKRVKESLVIKSALIIPPDANNVGTIFGGKVMSYIDDVAALSARRHCRMIVVTASTDSVDFLRPLNVGQAIHLEAFVSWTNNTSMEVFVKVMGEDLWTGERFVGATAFLTFVALDNGKPHPVPPVIPESEQEKELFDTAPERSRLRRERRHLSRNFAEKFGMVNPWGEYSNCKSSPE